LGGGGGGGGGGGVTVGRDVEDHDVEATLTAASARDVDAVVVDDVTTCAM